MGSLTNSPQLRAAFNEQFYPSGLDLNRGKYNNCLGVWYANASATFYAGQPVSLDSGGNIVLANGSTQILGVAKWSKATTAQSQVIDYPVAFSAGGQLKNLQPNIVGNVQVNSAPQGAGTVYSSSTDYTLNTTNGTITQIASGSGGTIPLNTTVYVSFSWQPTAFAMQLEGLNFWQTLDYVTQQELRVAVVQAPAEIFTTFFDPSVQYTFTGATSNVYVNASGLFTSSTSGSAKLVGKCINIPSAADPYLGIEFFGNVGVNS